jgi:anion-transporting  ArsA/GET3 family ATPase
MSGMMQDLAFSIPGVDEAMNFAEVMKQVNSMEYSVIIFDTAPTGHTLRFLSFPTVLEKALAKVSQLSSRFGPMMNQMSGLLGVQQGGTDELFTKLETMRETVKLVNDQFQYCPLCSIDKQGSRQNDLCMCHDCRVFEFVGNGTDDPGIDTISYRHTQHCHKLSCPR